MAPLDPDDPCYVIIYCRPSLDCDTHIEFEYFTSKIQPRRIDICCHCASSEYSPVTLDTSLKPPEGPYTIVMPIFEVNIAIGRHIIIVRAARKNAQAKQTKLDAHVAREARRQKKYVEEVDASIPTSYGAELLAPT